MNLLTTAEVAEMLRTAPSTVRYWRHIGTGPQSVKIGRRVLYAEADVHAWLQRQREEQDTAARISRACRQVR